MVDGDDVVVFLFSISHLMCQLMARCFKPVRFTGERIVYHTRKKIFYRLAVCLYVIFVIYLSFAGSFPSSCRTPDLWAPDRET